METHKQVIRGKMEVAGIMGPLWLMGWLFTVGFADLSFIQGLWGLVVWPYYLGSILGG